MPKIDPLDLVRLNPGVWLETYGFIKDVRGKLVRPKLNVLQRRMNALMFRRMLQQRPCRGQVVKPRKRGCSTMVGAGHYHQLMSFRHEGIIIGDKLETAEIVFRMMADFADTDEFRGQWGSPHTATTESIKWDHGSSLYLGTARGKATARGRTPQYEHWTEAAHWEGAAEAMDAAMNAIPDEGFNSVWQESTPFGEGEPFHKNWLTARWPTADECPDGELYWKQWESLCPDQPFDQTGLSQHLFVRVFAAWYEFEESRIALTPAHQEKIRETIDAESWYSGERQLIDLYGNDGPHGPRARPRGR